MEMDAISTQRVSQEPGHVDTCVSPPTPPFLLPGAHICMEMQGGLRSKVTFPCLWALVGGIGTRSLSKLKKTQEQAALFP